MKKKTCYRVVESAGTDQEFVWGKECKSLMEAEFLIKRRYTKEEIKLLNVDIMLQLPDGTLTTEF